MPTDYYAMIHEPVLTERAILTVKRALNNGRIKLMFFWPCRPITGEQTAKGLLWLRKNLNRKCCRALTPADKQCLDMSFRAFTFDGFAQRDRLFTPIYTVHSKDGHWFSYIYDAGSVTVLGRGLMCGHMLRIEIELGNEAMLTGDDVTVAIEAALIRVDLTDVLEGRSLMIMDRNGDTVGTMRCFRRSG